jgi:[acyl-carrier-protein] S-malonyltransferase
MAAAGGGAMAAVIGLDAPAIGKACGRAQEVGPVGIANYNCPGQVVITGEPEAVREASRLIQEAGAKRVVPLRVSGAFHSALMQPAAEGLRPVLDTAPFADARVPLVSNVDAEPRTDGAGIREALARQITGAVLWEPSVRRMVAEGIDTFIEVGPGKVLAGLIRRTCPDVTVHAAGTVDDLASLAP